MQRVTGIERSFGRPFEEVFEEFDSKYRSAAERLLRSTKPPCGKTSSHILSRPQASQTPAPGRPTSPPSTRHATLPRRPPSPSRSLHPRVNQTISRDLSNMYFFARALSLIPSVQWLSLPDKFDVFGGMMRSQLDLREEAANLQKFEGNFKDRNSVGFPRPLEEYSSTNVLDVLVEEFEHALQMEAFLSASGGPYDEQLANMVLDAFLNKLFLDNFVHSDLHLGSIMVKLYKPSTRFFLRTALHSLLGTPELSEAALFENSDNIVSQAALPPRQGRRPRRVARRARRAQL